MLYVSFNQDSTCFACGKENGFAIYNCDPPSERFSRLTQIEAEANGIGIVEMLHRSNIFAIVGGGRHPKYPCNMLMIWDDFQNKRIAELEFKSSVTGVKLRRDHILVTTSDKAYLYNFADLKLITSYDTSANPRGISAMTVDENAIIAVPGNVLGSVIIYNHALNTQQIITTHSNGLSAIALNCDGTRLATASERGTLLRIWDTQSRELIKELRRGLEVVTITSLTFDLDTTRLVVCSAKGTVHVFSLIQNSENDSINRKSSLSYISGYLPAYFSSEWSSVSFEVPPNSICTFSNTSVDTIYVITPDARFLKYTYDPQKATGSCIETIDIERLGHK